MRERFALAGAQVLPAVANPAKAAHILAGDHDLPGAGVIAPTAPRAHLVLVFVQHQQQLAELALGEVQCASGLGARYLQLALGFARDEGLLPLGEICEPARQQIERLVALCAVAKPLTGDHQLVAVAVEPAAGRHNGQ